MASLTGTKIKNTYDGLLKTTDNEPLDGTLRVITDGLGNNSALSLSTSAANVGGTLGVSGNATFDTNISVGGIIRNVNDLDTSISFGTNQVSLITGGLTRLSASDASVQVTNALVASSTLSVTGNYNSTNGDISLANGKIVVGDSVSIANSVGAAAFSPNANLLVIGDTGAAANQGMTIVSPTGATGNIYFADGTTGDAEYRGSITYNHNVDTLYLGAAATNKLAISGTQSIFSGNVLVTGTLPSYTNSLYVDSTTNNVGIGTNNPQNSSGYSGLHLNGATGGVVKFMDDASVVSQIFGNNNEITIQAEGARDVVVKTSNSERLRIEDAGASVTGTLAVSGAATLSSTLAVTGTSAFTGNIGVGFAPQANIKTFVYDNSANFALAVQQDGSGTPFQVTSGGTIRMQIKNGGDISFRDSSANEAFYWDASAGSLGIGAGSSPSALLTLGSGYSIEFNVNALTPRIDLIDNNVYTGGLSSNNGLVSLTNNSNNAIAFKTAGSERMRIDSSGNVGIGVTPNTWFSVYKPIQLGSYGAAITGQTNDERLGLWSNVYPDASNVVRYVNNGGGSLLFMNDGEFKFESFPSGTAGATATGTERMRIAANGNVSIAGDLSLTPNNSAITFSSGYARFFVEATERMRILPTGGITFNGDTSTANALDDYEEGTFTPTFSPTSGAFASITYNVQYGKYTKIGNRVDINLQISCSTVSLGTAGGVLVIGGLPFTVGAKVCPVSLVFVATWPTNRYPFRATFNDGATNILLRYVTALNDNETYLAGTDIQAGSEITISGTYFI